MHVAQHDPIVQYHQPFTDCHKISLKCTQVYLYNSYHDLCSRRDTRTGSVQEQNLFWCRKSVDNTQKDLTIEIFLKPEPCNPDTEIAFPKQTLDNIIISDWALEVLWGLKPYR